MLRIVNEQLRRFVLIFIGIQHNSLLALIIRLMFDLQVITIHSPGKLLLGLLKLYTDAW